MPDDHEEMQIRTDWKLEAKKLEATTRQQRLSNGHREMTQVYQGMQNDLRDPRRHKETQNHLEEKEMPNGPKELKMTSKRC